MKLAQQSETLAVNEKSSWLASADGIGFAGTIKIDGAAFGAIYADGLAKSGTIVALNTSTQRYVPYDQATSANGLNVPAGILYRSIDIRDGAGGFVNSIAPMLRRGQVITAKLPRSAAQTGGPHADAITALKGLFIFRTA